MADEQELCPSDVAAAILKLSVRTLQQARWDAETQMDCFMLPTPVWVGRRVFYNRAEVVACQQARMLHPKLAKKFMKEEASA